MELIVLDQNFKSVALVDYFESLIWTDRYFEYGDFEIYTSANKQLFDTFKHDYYLYSPESEHVMIIETVEIIADAEDGSKLKIEGRSLESILDRRIVWTQTSFDNANLQNGVKTLLNNSVIDPSISERKISNFIFEDSTDPEITKLKLTAQYTGDTVYDVIVDICKSNKIGFKITLNDDNQFVFKLYKGIDRSYAQNVRPYVVFSPRYENILNSNYLESKTTLKNITLVAGEGEGTARRTATVGEGSGLERRELYTDARDISSRDGDTTISDAKYMEMLQTRGKEKLSENKTTKSFEGEVEATILFKYGEDFEMGDIVQLVNEYDIEHTTRIIEMVMTQEVGEITAYPTFEVIDDEEETS